MSQLTNYQIKVQPEPEKEIPSSEVKTKAERRRFTKAYKLKIVEEAERCKEEGDLGALLRREGLYDSHLWRWRKTHREGRLNAGKKEPKGNTSSKGLETSGARHLLIGKVPRYLCLLSFSQFT